MLEASINGVSTLDLEILLIVLILNIWICEPK